MNALLAGSVLGALGVVAGAFGAHALKAWLAPDALAAWETGVRFQLVHALALLAVGLLARQLGQPLRGPALALLLGTVLFSGSLYVLALGGPRWLGPVTPVGGLLLIVGWALLAFAARGL
jgi:uncharacterized membrane protein YgdD (TMEM256/DUF423 family)